MIFCLRVILLILPKCKLIWPHWIKKFCHSLHVSILSVAEPSSEKYLSVLEAEGSFWISTLMRLQGLVVWRMQAFLLPATKHMLAKEAKLLCLCAHSAQLCSEGEALGVNTQSVIHSFTNPGNGSLLCFETFCTGPTLRKKTKWAKLLLPDPDIEQLETAPSLTAPLS